VYKYPSFSFHSRKTQSPVLFPKKKSFPPPDAHRLASNATIIFYLVSICLSMVVFSLLLFGCFVASPPFLCLQSLSLSLENFPLFPPESVLVVCNPSYLYSPSLFHYNRGEQQPSLRVYLGPFFTSSDLLQSFFSFRPSSTTRVLSGPPCAVSTLASEGVCTSKFWSLSSPTFFFFQPILSIIFSLV